MRTYLLAACLLGLAVTAAIAIEVATSSRRSVEAQTVSSAVSLAAPATMPAADSSPEGSVYFDCLVDPDESPAIENIRAALRAKADIDFADVPLKDVVELLAGQNKIAILLDEPACKEAGIDAGITVTKSIHGKSLRSALHLMLDPLQLAFAIHNGVLLITSQAKAESDEFMTTRIYPVNDIVMAPGKKGEIRYDCRSLIEMLTQTIATKTWVDNGGQATIRDLHIRDACLLVVSQSQEIQDEIAALLTTLRKAGNLFNKDKGRRGKEPVGYSKSESLRPGSAISTGTLSNVTPTTTLSTTAESAIFDDAVIITPEQAQMPEDSAIVEYGASPEVVAAVGKIRSALQARTSMNITARPLKDVIARLGEVYRINIVLDEPALKEANIEPDVAVTQKCNGVSLRHALRVLLGELHLTYTIRNGVLLITTPIEIEKVAYINTRLYPVKDLVLVRNEKGQIEADFQPLKEVVRQIASRKIGQDDGDGRLFVQQYVQDQHLYLAVSQREEVHDYVVALLATIRKAIKAGNR